MKDYQGYLIDLDGTIYKGKEKYPAGKRFIERLKAAGKDYLFVTNNSTKTPGDVAQNLTVNHDIPTDSGQVYTSAMATADYLQAQGDIKRVLVVGEDGLRKAMVAAGFELVEVEPADAVIVALDRDVTYERLMHATFAIQQGAKFVATNIDTNLPNELGMTPGAGAFVKFMETATQTEPIVIGKPGTTIIELALQRMKLQREQAVMVGDNYNTDILAGINAKMDTLLVYTGVSTPEQVHAEAQQPTNEVESLDEWEIK